MVWEKVFPGFYINFISERDETEIVRVRSAVWQCGRLQQRSVDKRELGNGGVLVAQSSSVPACSSVVCCLLYA